MKGLKVFIEGIYEGELHYTGLFASLGFNITSEMSEDVDLVCFTGGSDVSPELYNQKAHPTTMSNPDRDKKCLDLFNKCLELGIPMVGICRGSQFLCVANKGSLWQDIDGHLGSHPALTVNGDIIEVTSTHHQEMNPVGGKIILTAQAGGYRAWCNENGISVTARASSPTVEGVFWKDTLCLGVQGHPEFPQAKESFVNWFKEEVYKLCVA